jgi:hypothetical protein
MLLSIIGFAFGLRWCSRPPIASTWIDRWYRTLGLLLLPPLLLFTTAIAIVLMGPHGKMILVWEDWIGHYLSLLFLGFAAAYLLKLVTDSRILLDRVRTHSIDIIDDHSVRILDSIVPYSAQIGFWQPELVLTQGLLDLLSPEHLKAVFAHEQAHVYYRDTFWFFWLGWIRQVTQWLPQTEALWQELLMLREIRADRWASQQTDGILVAEALIKIVQFTPDLNDFCTANFNHVTTIERLEQRIEALSSGGEVEVAQSSYWQFYLSLLMPILPLLTLPLHH